mmetsp:Transcript_2441/g.5593  ORF Transcript_2441/g.5593 Transcript_2441/m.5593 type:complete len:205 (+) Transcript_2441:230-844(+)
MSAPMASSQVSRGAFAAFAACSAAALLRASVRFSRQASSKAPTDSKTVYSLTDVREMAKPMRLQGEVVRGFGRGGKLLGCPTANLDEKSFGNAVATSETGVYFGWAQLDGGAVHKMVTSIGWNPYFKNDKKTVEPHILHAFKGDFYGKTLTIVVCGYIRPELNFDSMEALVAAIENDKRIAEIALEDPRYAKYKDLLAESKHAK